MRRIIPRRDDSELTQLEKHLPEMVDILRTLSKPEDQRSLMLTQVNALLAVLVATRRGLPAETAAATASYVGEVAQPLFQKSLAWTTAQGYFEGYRDEIIAAGVPEDLFDEVCNFEMHTRRVKK